MANRKRRIPKRIRMIQAELASFDRRVAELENLEPEQMAPSLKATLIKKIRQSAAPLHAQLRRLVDRGGELGLQIAA